MTKSWLFLFVFITSCSTVFIDENKNEVYIPSSTAYDASTDGILLTWDYSDQSFSITILRGSSENNLLDIKVLEGQQEWLDNTAFPGNDYYYRIEARTSTGDRVGVSDVQKGRRLYQSTAETPIGFINNKASVSKISLSWKGQKSQSYKLYRDDVFLSDVAAESYEDTGLKPGTTYSYKLAAVYKEGVNIKEKFFDSGKEDINSAKAVNVTTAPDTL